MYFEQVNANYLDTLNIVNENTPIQASEDIYAENGMKLLAKGSRIDNRVRENLIKHRLVKPLERQISLDAAPIIESLQQRTKALFESDQLFKQLLGDNANTFISALMKLQWSDVTESTLNIILQRFPDHFDHGLKVAATAFRIAFSLKLPQLALLQAALFHDVGYLYLDEQVWQRSNALTAERWRQLDTHPVIGYHWASELGEFGKEAAMMILQHHERLDGSGYPQRVEDVGFGLPSQALALSEMLVGIFENRSNPSTQLMVSLKLLPGQFSPAISQCAMELVGELDYQIDIQDEESVIVPAVHDLFRKIALISEHLYDIQRFLDSDKSRNLVAILLVRLDAIQMALTRSGLSMLKSVNLNHKSIDPQLIQEQVMIIDESLLQLKLLARDISRGAVNLTETEVRLFEPLQSRLEMLWAF